MIKSGKSPIQKKPYWVKAKWVIRATGWTKDEMRDARTQGMITWKHSDEDGFQYDLNSIHPLLLKQNALAAETTNA